MRGYLLAGQEDFLDPYNPGQETTYAAIDQLRETVNDNPAQVERLNQIEATLREWQETVTEPTIALRRKIGDAKTMNDMAAKSSRYTEDMEWHVGEPAWPKRHRAAMA